MNKNLPIVIIGLVAIAAIIGGVILYRNNQTTTATTPATANSTATKPSTADAIQAAVNRYRSAPAGANPAWSKGAANATVTIEEFADFQCGACAFYSQVLRDVRTAYGDKVRIVFRQYPLQMHPKAYDAARAAEAAGLQGKFWEMHDLIFQKQKDWSLASVDHRKEFENYAKSLNLNVDQFTTDMIADNANRRVALDKQRGDFIGIRATPSIFLNGRLLLQDEMEINKMRQLIDAALQGK
jgi:protein-disulfide isomerase